MGSDRSNWEHASGPAVGAEVPVTSEPRDEDAPGVPAPPRTQAGREGGARRATERGQRSGRDFESRVVEVAEPQLPPEANARLTEEVREVVGADRVEVPRDRPHLDRGEQVNRPGLVAYMGTQRPMLLGTLAGAVVIGAIIALITNSWWVLLVAVGAHALATMIVVAIIIRMTTTVEHPSPDLAATLSQEGIRNPDEHFSRLVHEFSPQPRAETGDLASPANDRDAESG